MLGACRQIKLPVGQLSFARALTETRLFLKLLLTVTDVNLWAFIWTTHKCCCAKHRVTYKPDRRFTRDRQEYRRKSRGLEKRRKNSKRKYQQTSPPAKPETHKGAKEQLFLLS